MTGGIKNGDDIRRRIKMEQGKLLVGYDRECVTPEIGTYLGGYGNGKDRQTIGKIYEDDDLFATVIAVTDTSGETVLLITVDIVRIPYKGYMAAMERIEKATGIPEVRIIMSGTHSHSSPDFVDDAEYAKKWTELFLQQVEKAAVKAMEDRRPAEAFMGVKEVEKLNFVRRYMKNGKFYGTNAVGDAHESEADNHLQILMFRREGAEDVVLCNFGAHADHSKDFGGPAGDPTFHRGCSADYIYSLRKTVEAKKGVKFAFFQGAAGNLNPISKIEEECARLYARMEKDQTIRPIAYGRELGDEVCSVLEAPMEKLSCGRSTGMRHDISAARAKGPEVGSPEFNKAVALSVVAFAQRTLEKPTKESIDGARFIMEKWELGDDASLDRIAADENHPKHDYAVIAKVLRDGGRVPKTGPITREIGFRLTTFYGFISGLYSANGLISHSLNQDKPPIVLPLHTLCCGDFAFAAAPGELFDTNGLAVKTASPFKMTFYVEMSGGAFGYFPSKLAWSHGGYELGTTAVEEGTAEAIADEEIKMLHEMYEELQK